MTLHGPAGCYSVHRTITTVMPPRQCDMSSQLRKQVERLLPGWESWYPSLFDAAQDLGLIKARVCPPSSLVLSNRHAAIYGEAVQAFRAQWNAEDETFPSGDERAAPTTAGTKKRKRRRGARR